MSLTKKVFFALIAFSFLAASASAREAAKPTKELTVPRATTLPVAPAYGTPGAAATKAPLSKPVEMSQPAPTATAKPKAGGPGGGEDGNRTTASYCVDAYLEMAAAVFFAEGKETIRFRNVSLIGETGFMNQELLCFLPGAHPAIDRIFFPPPLSGGFHSTNLSLCMNGYKDSAWKESCFHPSEIAGLKNEKKAALWNAGWTDAIAIDPNNAANQEDNVYYDGFTSLPREVPYIIFESSSLGDPMLLRALAGYEDIHTLMLSGETWACIAWNVRNFIIGCRY